MLDRLQPDEVASPSSRRHAALPLSVLTPREMANLCASPPAFSKGKQSSCALDIPSVSSCLPAGCSRESGGLVGRRGAARVGALLRFLQRGRHPNLVGPGYHRAPDEGPAPECCTCLPIRKGVSCPEVGIRVFSFLFFSFLFVVFVFPLPIGAPRVANRAAGMEAWPLRSLNPWLAGVL